MVGNIYITSLLPSRYFISSLPSSLPPSPSLRLRVHERAQSEELVPTFLQQIADQTEVQARDAQSDDGQTGHSLTQQSHQDQQIHIPQLRPQEYLSLVQSARKHLLPSERFIHPYLSTLNLSNRPPPPPRSSSASCSWSLKSRSRKDSPLSFSLSPW